MTINKNSLLHIYFTNFSMLFNIIKLKKNKNIKSKIFCNENSFDKNVIYGVLNLFVNF